MKKMLFGVVLIVCVLFVLSCRTTGEAVTGITEVTDAHFQEIYDRHFEYLILEGARHHTVQYGDTLYYISRYYYGDGAYYPVIMLASHEIVLDPNDIKPGMVLTIPDLQANLDNPNARAAVKGVILDCADIEEARGWIEGAHKLRELANSLKY